MSEISELIQAIISGDIQATMTILKGNPDLIYETDEDDDTALHKAALLGRTEIASLLILFGADVNEIGCSQRTPLNNAAAEKHGEMVQILLEKGALLGIPDALLEIPLHKLSYHGMDQTISFVLSNVYGGNYNLNHRNVLGCTPLHNAAHNGHLTTCQLLISLGADPSIKDDFGYTAAETARHRRYFRVAEFLEQIQQEFQHQTFV